MFVSPFKKLNTVKKISICKKIHSVKQNHSAKDELHFSIAIQIAVIWFTYFL